MVTEAAERRVTDEAGRVESPARAQPAVDQRPLVGAGGGQFSVVVVGFLTGRSASTPSRGARGARPAGTGRTWPVPVYPWLAPFLHTF